MNPKSAAFLLNRLIISIIALVLFAAAAVADSMNFAGTIDTNDIALQDCQTNYAEIIPFEVSDSGSYQLGNPSPSALFNGPTFFYAAVFSTIPDYATAHPDRLFLINNAGNGAASGQLTENRIYYLVVGGSSGCGSVYPVDYAFSFSGPGTIRRHDGDDSLAGGRGVNRNLPRPFTDGRINRWDMAAPIAVYPIAVNDEYGLIVYDTYVEDSELLFISPEQIAAITDVSENTLIARSSDGRVSVYRLTDGTFQIDAPTRSGKRYQLNFGEVSPGVVYTSTEIE